MAMKIREDSGVDYGFIFQGAEYEGGVVNGLEYIYTHGGEVLADSGRRAVADQPEAIAGLRTERSMIESGAAPISVVAYKEPETHTTFPGGRAVFARNWPYMYGIIADPTQSQITPEQIAIAPIPHAEGSQSFSGLGGWIMMINAASKDKADAAWEFIKYAAMEPKQQKFRAIEGGFLPPLKSLYEDPEILEKVPVARFAKESLENAKPRPVSPFYSDMSLAMAEKFADSLRGEIPPEQAAQQLDGNMTRTIALGRQLLA
jgi:multiple sugar transport system substrate-binding protein